jgi:hypothetical protein
MGKKKRKSQVRETPRPALQVMRRSSISGSKETVGLFGIVVGYLFGPGKT